MPTNERTAPSRLLSEVKSARSAVLNPVGRCFGLSLRTLLSMTPPALAPYELLATIRLRLGDEAARRTALRMGMLNLGEVARRGEGAPDGRRRKERKLSAGVSTL